MAGQLFASRRYLPAYESIPHRDTQSQPRSRSHAKVEMIPTRSSYPASEVAFSGHEPTQMQREQLSRSLFPNKQVCLQHADP